MVSLNPDNVLKRGYARITGPDGTTLTTRAAAAGAPLTLHFHDGTLDAAPTGAPPVPPRAAPRLARKADSAAPAPRQDDLFG
jgi:exodeoxyribonuclease VII large subunit